MQTSTENVTNTGAYSAVFTKTVMSSDVQCAEFHLAIHTLLRAFLPPLIDTVWYEVALLSIVISQYKAILKYYDLFTICVVVSA